MIIVAWNCRGIARAATVHALRALVRAHHPSLIFISELKISSFHRLSRTFTSLGFSQHQFVPVVGTSGGLALGWTPHITLYQFFFYQLSYLPSVLYAILAFYGNLLSTRPLC